MFNVLEKQSLKHLMSWRIFFFKINSNHKHNSILFYYVSIGISGISHTGGLTWLCSYTLFSSVLYARVSSLTLHWLLRINLDQTSTERLVYAFISLRQDYFICIIDQVKLAEYWPSVQKRSHLDRKSLVNKTNIICTKDNVSLYRAFSWLFAFHFSFFRLELEMIYLQGVSNQIKVGGLAARI